jgi:DNA-binding NarL/FixJ family response regulator
VLDRKAGPDELVRDVAAALSGDLPAERAAARVPGPRGPILSRREHEVLELMARGLANRDIAGRLDISPHTVRTHVQAVLAKLEKGNRVAAVGAARRAGLLT